MSAGVYDIVLDEGTKLEFELIYKDSGDVIIPLTGYSAEFKVKYKHTSSTVKDWSAYATVTGAEGKITIEVPASVTSDIGFEEGVYNIDVINDSDPDDKARLLYGNIIVNREV